MHVEDLDTPALTIDLDILEENIHNLAESCRRHDIALRVHTKTHKIPAIAHMQLRAGAAGIVCQKLGEAEAMVATGIPDILIPYNIVGRRKVERLLQLCKQAVLTVAVDSKTTARGISKQAAADDCRVRVLVELDTGSKRCGVQSPEAALELAQKIVDMPGLDFQGKRGRAVTVLFGDAAGAAVLGPSDEQDRGLLAYRLHAEGEHADKLWASGPSHRHRPRLDLSGFQQDLHRSNPLEKGGQRPGHRSLLAWGHLSSRTGGINAQPSACPKKSPDNLIARGFSSSVNRSTALVDRPKPPKPLAMTFFYPFLSILAQGA